MAKCSQRSCPRFVLPLCLAYWLAVALTFLATHVTKQPPLLPVDIMRTARWGGIEYDCGKSKRVLGLRYTPIEQAVKEAMQDVQGRTLARKKGA